MWHATCLDPPARVYDTVTWRYGDVSTMWVTLRSSQVFRLGSSSHCSLAMTVCFFQGGYRACSRLGIDSNASPFLKITFETASHFLTVRFHESSHLPRPRSVYHEKQAWRRLTSLCQ